MSPRSATLFLMAAGLVAAACTSRIPPAIDFHIGDDLVATVDVVRELDEVAIFDLRARGVELEVVEVHWVGTLRSGVAEAPPVEVGDTLKAMRLPGYDYRVGERYVASFIFVIPGADGYEWWLTTGLDLEGRVVTNSDFPKAAQRSIEVADAVDGDVDPPAVLLAGLAAENEVMLNARDAGVAEEELPLGPMLTAVYRQAGLLPETTTTVDIASLPPEARILPIDLADPEADTDMLTSLGVAEAYQVEGMVVHGPSLSGVSSIALWFPGLARSAAFLVDQDLGVTAFRTVAPAGVNFDLVGFPPPTEADTGPRRWTQVVASDLKGISRPDRSDTVFLVITLTDRWLNPSSDAPQRFPKPTVLRKARASRPVQRSPQHDRTGVPIGTGRASRSASPSRRPPPRFFGSKVAMPGFIGCPVSISATRRPKKGRGVP